MTNNWHLICHYLSFPLFSFSIIKKIEMTDIYNGPHPNRASWDGITNLWDLQLTPPHFYFFSATFVFSPIKIERSEKQRACCCYTFIPNHLLHSLFVLDNKKWKGLFCPEIRLNSSRKRNENYFFQKSLVTKFLYFCFASCLESFVDDSTTKTQRWDWWLISCILLGKHR